MPKNTKKSFCGHCERLVGKAHLAFACDNCEVWVHLKCTTYTRKTYRQVQYGEREIEFHCKNCTAAANQTTSNEAAPRSVGDNEVGPSTSESEIGSRSEVEAAAERQWDCMEESIMQMEGPTARSSLYPGLMPYPTPRRRLHSNDLVDDGRDGRPHGDGDVRVVDNGERRADNDNPGVDSGERRENETDNEEQSTNFHVSAEYLRPHIPDESSLVNTSQDSRGRSLLTEGRIVNIVPAPLSPAARRTAIDMSPEQQQRPQPASRRAPIPMPRRLPLPQTAPPISAAPTEERPEQQQRPQPASRRAPIPMPRRLPLPQTAPHISSAPTEQRQKEIPYQVHQKGTHQGKELLVSSEQYTYTIDRVRCTPRGRVTYWKCSNRKSDCKARVTEVDGNHKPTGTHNHEPDPITAAKREVMSKVKEIARKNPYRSAAAIVEDEMVKEHVTNGRPLPSKKATLVRIANRARQKSRPQHPKDLNFEIETDSIPTEFLQKDVRTGQERHLIMMSSHGKELLSKAKTWYMDGTFKVARPPFAQLFTVHVFVRQGETNKQVPGLFVLMSRRRTADYIEVLRAVKEIVGNTQVEAFVADFETAIWKAAREVFEVDIFGCLFHQNQAIYRKAQELGLQIPYRNTPNVRKYMKRLMALAYLPHEQISEVFEKLWGSVNRKVDCRELEALYEYYQQTWLQSAIWPVRCWSAYGRYIRTNNDVEGWHHRLNKKMAKSQINMYELVEHLHSEAILSRVYAQCVASRTLCRDQAAKTRTTNGKLARLWQRYDSDHLSTYELLVEASELIGSAIAF